MVDMCVDACIVSEDPTALDYIVCSTIDSGVEPTVMGGLPTSGFLLFLLINAETVEDNKGTFSSEKALMYQESQTSSTTLPRHTNPS